jgi:hypothetical protein
MLETFPAGQVCDRPDIAAAMRDQVNSSASGILRTWSIGW